MTQQRTVSWPIRMPAELADQIKLACTLTGLSQQDVTRLAIRIGLEDLKRCNHDLATAVVDAAHREKILPLTMLAEVAADYSADKLKLPKKGSKGK